MLDLYLPLYATVFFLSLFFTALLTSRLIPTLRRVARQPIYEEGPRWHMKKSGTPTMGGLSFLICLFVLCTVATVFFYRQGERQTALSLTLSTAFICANAVIGAVDDLTKLRRKENAGLSPIQKLLFQLLICILFLLGRRLLLGAETALTLGGTTLELGFLYYPITVFLTLGTINCANLTDGIDGLAGSVAFAIGVSFFYISATRSSEVSLLSSILMGSTIGFLIFNLHPARIFMGDTGSLVLGAIACASAISFGNPLLLIPLCAVYVIEGISVILQVGYFKLTGKRLFLMAPLHHHLERLGWGENRICIVAILLTLLCSLPAYLLYLP